MKTYFVKIKCLTKGLFKREWYLSASFKMVEMSNFRIIVIEISHTQYQTLRCPLDFTSGSEFLEILSHLSFCWNNQNFTNGKCSTASFWCLSVSTLRELWSSAVSASSRAPWQNGRIQYLCAKRNQSSSVLSHWQIYSSLRSSLLRDS